MGRTYTSFQVADKRCGKDGFTQRRKCGMGEIRRKPDLLHALLTIDVIFLDKVGQVSSDQLATIGIILRKGKYSLISFAGVMFVCTMNPCQLGPINVITAQSYLVQTPGEVDCPRVLPR